ncbi:MAG: hypothetical protein AB8G17_09880 [Gammaproteobacteria bacterium]
MRRLLITLVFLGLLGALLWLAMPMVSLTPPPSTAEPAAPLEQTEPNAFTLRLSTRLAAAPTRAPARASAPLEPAWWEAPATPRIALILLAASILGLCLGSLWRGPRPTAAQAQADVVARRATLVDDLDGNDAQNADFSHLRQTHDAQRQQWEDERANLEQRNAELEADLSTRTTDAESATGDHERLAAKLNTSQAQLGDAHQRLRELEDDLGHSRDEQARNEQSLAGDRDRLAAELDASQIQLDEAQQRIRALDEDLGHSRDEHAKAMSDANARREAELTALRDDHDAQCEALSKQIVAHETQIGELESDIVNATSELELASKKSEQWRTEAAALEAALEDRDQTIGLLRDEDEASARLRAEHAQLQDEKQQLDTEWASLCTEHKTTRAELDRALAGLAQSEEQCAALAARLAEREYTLHELDSAHTTLRDALIVNTDERDGLRADLERSVAELTEHVDIVQTLEMGLQAATNREAALSQRHSDSHERNEQLFAQLSESLEKHDAAIAEYDLLTAQHEALTTRHDQVNDQLRAANAALDDTHAQIEQLTTDTEELEQTRETLAQWQSTMDSFRNDIRRKTERIDALDAQGEQLNEQRIELQEKTANVELLERKLAEQNRLSRVLKDGADSMRLYKAKTDELKQTVVALEHELAAQRATSAQQVEALRAQQEDAARLHESIDETQTYLDQTKALSSERQAQAAALESELAQRVDELAQTRETLSVERHERAQMRDDLDDFIAVTESIGALLDTPVDALDEPIDIDFVHSHETALDSLRMSLVRFEAVDHDAIETTAILRKAESEAIALAQDLSELRPQLHSVEKALQERQTQCDVLEAEVERQARQLNDAQTLREELAVLDDEHAQLKQTTEELDAKRAHVSTQLDQLHDIRAALEAEGAAAQEQRDRLADQVNDLNQEIARSEQARAAAESLSLAAERRERTALFELAQLQHGYTALETDTDQAAQSKDQLSEELEDAQQQARDAQSRLRDIEHDRARLGEELERARADVAEQTELRQSAQAAHREVAEEMATLEEQLTQAREALSHIDAEHQQLQARLRESDQQAAQDQEARNTLLESAQAAETLRGEVAELEQSLSERESTLGELLGSIGEITNVAPGAETPAQQLATIARQLETKDGRIDELARANLALRDAMREVRSEADATAQRLRAQIERAELTAKSLTADIERAHRDVRVAREHEISIEALKTDLAQREQEIETLKNSLTEFETKADSVAPALARKPVEVPVLSRPIKAPPVLTRAVTQSDDEE